MYNLAQIDDWAGVFSFNFTFTPAYDENVAFSLCEIMFAVIEIYLVPEMWAVRQARDPQAIDPTPLDAHVNLKFFKQETIERCSLQSQITSFNKCMQGIKDDRLIKTGEKLTSNPLAFFMAKNSSKVHTINN
jgi:hypothetical protein